MSGESRATAASGPLAPLVTVLTGADQKFARTLWQFLKSAERAGLQHRHRWIAYDLGLSAGILKSLTARFAWCTFKPFDFALWPAHLQMRQQNYAWKPVLVAQEVLAGQGVVLWFDCATLFKGALDEAIQSVRRWGLWYLRGQTPLYRHADARALDAMQVPPEVRHLRECVSGALGFDASHSAARRIALEWQGFALQAAIIAPPGASLSTHKYDQALLSGVLFKAVKAGEIPLSMAEIDISSTGPVRWMASRNKVAPWVPVWADLAVRAVYRATKALDRHWLRLSRGASTRLGGLRRYLTEDFTVRVTDHAAGRSRFLPVPRYGYLADPFIWSTGEGTWVFAEEFSCATERGRLVVLELDPDLCPVSKSDLQIAEAYGQIDCHVSFPFVFEHLGRRFMIPETSQRRTVDLYECEVWPQRWRFFRRLLLDVDAADTMAVQHDGRWWLFTSAARGQRGRGLEIYSCADITLDPLEPHPVNAQRHDAGAPCGTGRNAGLIAPGPGGDLRRFVQSSADYYGQGGAFRRITRLTRTEFEEEPTEGTGEDHPVVDLRTCHHYSRSGQFSATDQRSRASFWDFFRPGRSRAGRR